MNSSNLRPKKMISLLIALILTFAIVLLSLNVNKGRKQRYDVIFFGDSRVGNDRTETAISWRLAEKTGLKVFNAGIGGTTMANNHDSTLSLYSMVSLSKAVAMNDFSVQVAAIPTQYIENNDILYYVPDTVKELSKIDVSKAKYIIIEQCTNDYLSGIALENPDNPYDEATVMGALRVSVNNIRSAVPDAKIIVISPCMTFTIEGYGDELDFGYGTEEDFADAERKVCEELGVSFVDFYHESGITRDNVMEYLFDGLHPSDYGNQVLLDLIIKEFD